MTPRDHLRTRAAERGISLAALSRTIGRNPAYLQQYVARGSPRILPERDRRALATILQLPEHALMENERCEPALDDEDLIEATGRALWERDPENLPWEVVHEQWQPRYRELAKCAIDFLRPMVRDGRFR